MTHPSGIKGQTRYAPCKEHPRLEDQRELIRRRDHYNVQVYRDELKATGYVYMPTSQWRCASYVVLHFLNFHENPSIQQWLDFLFQHQQHSFHLLVGFDEHRPTNATR